jgi:UDP-N-acetylmuramyl tripeptide synthase
LSFFSNTIESCRPQVIANADDAKLLQAISPVTNDIVGFRVDSPEQIKFEPTDKHSSLIIDDMVTVTLQKDGSLNVAVPSLINKIFTAYTQLPGTYNLYNVAAAIATCSQILDTYNYISTLNTYKPAFGRGEEIQLMHSTIHLFLVKNPAGYDSVLQHIARSFDEQQLHMVFALNDKIADGKDVSWIWDVEFEPFFESFTPTKTHTLGTRAYDMLLRLQYANAEVTIHQGDYSIANLVDSIKHDKESQHITILATYTALLSIRKELSKLIPTYTNNINKQGN